MSNNAFIEVESNQGAREQYALKERTVVGSATSADVRVSGLEPEHLLFVPRGRRGCWVAVATTSRDPVVVDGQPFANGLVPWGQTLKVRTVTLRANRRTRNLGPLRPYFPWAGIAVAGLFLAWTFMNDSNGAEALGPRMLPPPLFAQKSVCPKDVEPTAHGVYARNAADAKSERYPFDPSDGVKAVLLYREAAACFSAANLPAEAAESLRESEPMQRKVEADYVSLSLDLDLAIAKGDKTRGLETVRALMPLLGHVADAPYAVRLRQLERVFEMQIRKAKGKGKKKS
jgi:hypothetical protein